MKSVGKSKSYTSIIDLHTENSLIRKSLCKYVVNQILLSFDRLLSQKLILETFRKRFRCLLFSDQLEKSGDISHRQQSTLSNYKYI